MIKRARLPALIAVFVAALAFAEVLPRLAAAIRHIVSFGHPPPSLVVSFAADARSILFMTCLPLAYFLALRRSLARILLVWISGTIAILTLVLSMDMWRHFPELRVDTAAQAFAGALPWAFLSVLLYHPYIATTFQNPLPILFSIRCWIVVAAVHLVIVIGTWLVPGVSAFPSASPWSALLLFPYELGMEAFYHTGGRIVGDALRSPIAVGLLLLGIPLSSLVWGSFVALLFPYVRSSSATSII